MYTTQNYIKITNDKAQKDVERSRQSIFMLTWRKAEKSSNPKLVYTCLRSKVGISQIKNRPYSRMCCLDILCF
jgi:hypothetical protein